MIHLQEPYQQRAISNLDTWRMTDWRIKVYGISYAKLEPRAGLVDETKAQAEAVFPVPAVTDSRYGVGFVGIHDGRGANFTFFCWWENENELRHRVFSGPSDQFADLPEQPGEGVRACTWDVAVISFERDAWVRHVLSNPAGPDLEAYMDERLNRYV